MMTLWSTSQSNREPWRMALSASSLLLPRELDENSDVKITLRWGNFHGNYIYDQTQNFTKKKVKVHPNLEKKEEQRRAPSSLGSIEGGGNHIILPIRAEHREMQISGFSLVYRGEQIHCHPNESAGQDGPSA